MLLALLGDSSRAADPAGPYTEYQQRAWYLYLIAQYTEWPPEAFATPGAPFVLGILGKDPFEKDLELIKDKPVKGHPLQVRKFTRVEEAAGCHALYICDSERDRLKETMQALERRPILTFGEVPGFLKANGMVKFWMQRETRDQGFLYFEINPAAVKASRLRINAYVLKLAKPDPTAP